MQQVVCTTNGLTQLKNLNPYEQVEAETMAQESGIQTEVCSEGGQDVGYITNGCWTKLKSVDFAGGAAAFYARVASAGSGGYIALHLDSLVGPLVGTCAIKPTGGWQTWTTVSCAVGGADGVHDLYLEFGGGSGYLFNVNWWQMQQGQPLQIINAAYVTNPLSMRLVWNSTPPAAQTNYIPAEEKRFDRSGLESCGHRHSFRGNYHDKHRWLRHRQRRVLSHLITVMARQRRWNALLRERRRGETKCVGWRRWRVPVGSEPALPALLHRLQPDNLKKSSQTTNSSSWRCGIRPRSNAWPRKRRMDSLPFSP